MSLQPNNLFIKPGYCCRLWPEYFHDNLREACGIVHQPDVYTLAAHLGRRFGCSRVIDIGCGRAEKLAALRPDFEIIGIDHGTNIQFCRTRYAFGQWIEWDLEKCSDLAIDPEMVRGSILICADVIEHLVNPAPLLRTLKSLLDHASVAVISTPERELLYGADHSGPPANPCHVREWKLSEFDALLRAEDFRVPFLGLTVGNDQELKRTTILAVLENNSYPSLSPAPPDFRVVAIMVAYNEEDIIIPAIQKLVNQGIEVYLIDNWSTDSTHELAKKLLGRGLIGIEQFPASGPTATYDWQPLLARVEEVSCTLNTDWFIRQDVDEERESPWHGVSLRDGIFHADRLGFNCIEYTPVVFPPVDDGYPGGVPLGEYFKHWEFDPNPGMYVQKNTWKNLGLPVHLDALGGHEVQFEGRRVFPYRFTLRHYPIRSQLHGETKIFRERKARTNATEHAKGWNIHYHSFAEGHRFLRDPSALEIFDPDTFQKTYLVEWLTGTGTWLQRHLDRKETHAFRRAVEPRRLLNPLKLPKSEGYYAHARRDVIDLVIAREIQARHVLDLGCASGSTGQALKPVLNAECYVGIEIVPEMAERARARLDHVYCVDLETATPFQLGLAEGGFELLLALDVLEHLHDPWEILAHWAKILRPRGLAILSLPNVQNLTVLSELAAGRWEYTSEGLLDATHLRFFTLESIRGLLAYAGLSVVHVGGILHPPIDLNTVQESGNAIREGQLTLTGLSREEVLRLFTYQYLIVAEKL